MTPTPASDATPGGDPPAPRVIIRQSINAYAGPGREYARAGDFQAGERKDIVGRDASSGWWQVCCLNGEPVWIDANLAPGEGDLGSVPLATAAPLPPAPTATPNPTSPPSPTATPAIPVLTITDNAVRVRRGPGTGYPELDKVKTGQQFEITGRNDAGDWWQIAYNGQAGWVSRQFVAPAGDLDAVPVVQAPPPPVACTQPVDGAFAGTWTGEIKERIGCPIAPAAATDAAFEPFERGAMIWRKDVLQHYVIAADGGWLRFADVWIEGLPDFSCPDIAPSASPPTPLRGFGQVWCQNPDVRQRVGNALEPERAEQMVTQAFEHGFMIRTGRGIYALFDDGGWRSQ